MYVYVYICTVFASFSKLLFLLIINKNQTRRFIPSSPPIKAERWKYIMSFVSHKPISLTENTYCFTYSQCPSNCLWWYIFSSMMTGKSKKFSFPPLSFFYLWMMQAQELPNDMGKGGQIGLPSQSKNSRWWWADIPFLSCSFYFF